MIPHLAIPFTVAASGAEAVVNQDTPAEITQHAVAAARVRPGTLDADPAFGTTDQTFQVGGIDTGRLAAELAQCDPRPSFDIEQVISDAAAEASVTVGGERP